MRRFRRSNRRPNGNRRSFRRNTRNGGVLKRVKGGKLPARTNPQPAVITPWNSLTIQQIKTQADQTVYGVSYGVINSAIIAQALNGVATTIDVRVLDIHVTDLAGRAIALTPKELTEAGSSSNLDVITSMYDYPGRNSWASCKYSWPISQQVLSVSTTAASAGTVADVTPGVSDTAIYTTKNIMVRINVLWRCTANETPSLTHLGVFQAQAERSYRIARSLEDVGASQEVNDNIVDMVYPCAAAAA